MAMPRAEGNAMDNGAQAGAATGVPGDATSGLLSLDQLERLANLHSGLARVNVQEWAVLVRCRSQSPIEADALVRSLLDWFDAPLSVGEICEFIDRLVEQGFLSRLKAGAAYHTTALGCEVLDQAQRSLLRATIWMLGKREDEGDACVDR